MLEGVHVAWRSASAFDSTFAWNTCHSYPESYRMIFVYSIKEIFVCALRKTFRHLSDRAKKTVINRVLIQEHYISNNAFVSREVVLPLGIHPDLNARHGNDGAGGFFDHSLCHAAQKKPRHSFPRVRAHHNHIDILIPDEVDDSRPRTRKRRNFFHQVYSLSFLNWDGLRHSVQLLARGITQSTDESSFCGVIRLVNLHDIKENQHSAKFSREFERPCKCGVFR